MKYIVFCLFLISPLVSAETTLDAGRLFRVDESLDSQMEQVRKHATEVRQKAYSKILEEVPNLNPKQSEAIKNTMERYSEKMDALLNSDGLIVVWEDAFGSSLSDSEKLEALKFYSSPLGVKIVQGMNSANGVVQNEMMRTMKNEYPKLVNEFVLELQKAANCCTKQSVNK